MGYTGEDRNRSCMAQRIKSRGGGVGGGVLSLVKLDILSGSVSILSPHFPQLPESAQSSDVNNETLIWSIAASNSKKNPSQKSPLLQTYPSKRDISWCFCKETLRQSCFCYKKDLPVTGSCCAMPRTRLQIRITSQWNISGTSILNVYHRLVKWKGCLAFQRG